MHAAHIYYKKYHDAKYLHQRWASVQSNCCLNFSTCHKSLNVVCNMTESEGYQAKPSVWLLAYFGTSFSELPATLLAHETVHCPSNTVTWKSPSPPAYKHKPRKRLEEERPFASMLAVKARVQIPAHLLLRVTAEQELQFLVLGGIRQLFFCGVRNSTLEYPFQDTQIWHIKHFGISKRN